MCHLHLKLCTPAGAAVLRIPAKLLCVLAFEADQQTERHRPHNAHQPVKGSKAGGKVGKGHADGLSQADKLMSKIAARRQTVGRPQLEEHPTDEHIP